MMENKKVPRTANQAVYVERELLSLLPGFGFQQKGEEKES